MGNLELYDKVRACPADALKPIQAGRLKGKSDINPMWRIKKLTEQFGPCGFGWYYSIEKQWLETGANNEISAFVNINLYVRVGEEWSKPIPGTGGSAFVASERSGLYTSDECYKMALTDAISVACKALGFAADVYWSSDRTKYSSNQTEQKNEKKSPAQELASEYQIKKIKDLAKQTGTSLDKIMSGYKVDDLHKLPAMTAGKAIQALEKRAKEQEDKNA